MDTALRSLKYNSIANFIGRAWTAFLGVLLTPVYVGIMGIEAYGLFGIFITLQTVLGILDMGLSTSIIRELARLTGSDGTSEQQRNLVRTLEIFYWGASIAGGALIVLAAPWIANSWIRSEQISADSIAATVRIMGIAIALRLPFALYQGGLMGLQRQDILNTVIVGVGTLRSVGAIGVLVWVSPTLKAFLVWELLSAVCLTAVTRTLLLRSLPRTERPTHFDLAAFRNVSRFATGMVAISVVTTVLLQIDKLLLSRLLTLDCFGYYMVASTLGNGISMLASPIAAAAFPRISQLVAMREERSLRLVYHGLCQAVCIAVWPTVLILALFPHEVLLLWTGKPSLVANAAPLVTFIVLGWGLNALMAVPYSLQLAAGWTSLAFRTNAVASVLIVPLVIVSCQYFGALGAAASWMALNLGYVAIIPHIMHTRLLTTDKWKWYRRDVVMPIAAASIVTLLARHLIASSEHHVIAMGTGLGTTWLSATLAAALASQTVCRSILNSLATDTQKNAACKQPS